MSTAVSVSVVMLMLFATIAIGQTVNDTVLLKNINVTTEKFSSTKAIDSLSLLSYTNASLGNILSKFSGYNIRQYGSGGSATVAPRGYTPQQVSVKWNDVDLTNPMLGQTDLSLLPVFFFDAVELHNEPTLTDNSPAGSVNLNESFQQKGIQVSTYNAWSSLHNLTNALQFKSGSKHWNTSFNLFNSKNKNTFSYHNTAFADDSLIKQTHSESSGRGASAGIKYTSGVSSLRVGGFLYRLQRDIPPTMLQSIGKDEQDDQSSAAFIRYEYLARTSVKADVSANLNVIGFYDGLVDTTYDSHSAVYRSSISMDRRMKLIDISTRLQTSFTKAIVLPDVYNRSEWQHSIEAGLSKQIELLDLRVDVSGMQRLRENHVLPFNYSASISLTLIKNVRIKLTHARLSRLPSLNDRYWKPGGNPDLGSELATRNNFNALYSRSTENMTIAIDCDVYYDWVDNWIQWIPNGGQWSPKNVKSVLLYGVNPSAVMERRWNKVKASLTLRYNYNKAITQTSFAPNDASVDKQLMYVPIQTFHSHAVVATKKSSVFALFNYVDQRYTTSDNSLQLDSYFTIDAGLSHTFTLKQLALTASGKVENITGTDYQSIAWNPMPLQVYTFSLNIQFNFPNHEHTPQ